MLLFTLEYVYVLETIEYLSLSAIFACVALPLEVIHRE